MQFEPNSYFFESDGRKFAVSFVEDENDNRRKDLSMKVKEIIGENIKFLFQTELLPTFTDFMACGDTYIIVEQDIVYMVYLKDKMDIRKYKIPLPEKGYDQFFIKNFILRYVYGNPYISKYIINVNTSNDIPSLTIIEEKFMINDLEKKLSQSFLPFPMNGGFRFDYKRYNIYIYYNDNHKSCLILDDNLNLVNMISGSSEYKFYSTVDYISGSYKSEFNYEHTAIIKHNVYDRNTFVIAKNGLVKERFMIGLEYHINKKGDIISFYDGSIKIITLGDGPGGIIQIKTIPLKIQINPHDKVIVYENFYIIRQYKSRGIITNQYGSGEIFGEGLTLLYRY